jgi:hypothetical protein
VTLPLMSALGQKQTFALHQRMSALPRNRTLRNPSVKTCNRHRLGCKL